MPLPLLPGVITMTIINNKRRRSHFLSMDRFTHSANEGLSAGTADACSNNTKRFINQPVISRDN